MNEIARNRKLLDAYRQKELQKKAAEIFALLPQGEGSGLDADKLDGLHAKDILDRVDKLLHAFRSQIRVAGGGGGLRIHGNDYHDPDFSAIDHTHADLHRKWSWADEQGWDRSIVVPLSGRAADDEPDSDRVWTRYAGNPILSAGESGKWDDNYVHFPCVLRHGDLYLLYYTGHDGSNYKGIGLATSENPLGPFVRIPTNDGKVLGIGDSAPDNLNVYSPSVIYDEDAALFKMWYASRDTSNNRYVCYATSVDGITWTKQGSQISWGQSDYFCICVLKVGKMYHLTTGAPPANSRTLDLYTSNDGLSWVSRGTILAKGGVGEFDENECLLASMWWNLSMWYFFYTGRDSAGKMRIGMALSSNGYEFRKVGMVANDCNPIMGLGAPGEWDDYRSVSPSALNIERDFYIYYSAIRSGGKFQIGVAYMNL